MEEKKKFDLLKIIKSKAFIITCAVILVAAVLAVGISAALNSDPLAQVSKASKNSARSLSKSDAYEDITRAAEGGSIGFYWNLRPLTEQLAGYGIDLAVNYTVYSNAGDDAYYVDLAALIKGEEFVDASVYVDPDKVVASCPILLGDDSYGIKLDKFKEKFEKSPFGKNGAYSLDEYFGDVIEEFDTYAKELQTSDELSEDIAELYEEFIEVLMKSASKHANVTKEAGSVAFANETVKTTDVVIKFDSEAFCNLGKDFIKYLDKSKDVEAFIEKYAKMLGMNYGEYSDDILEEYRAAIDEAMANVDSLGEYIGDIELEIIVNISKSKKEIVGLTCKLSAEGESAELNMICGPTWNNISEFKIEATDGYEEFEISYLAKEDTKEAFDAELKVVSFGEELFNASVTWDKVDGEFEIAASSIPGEFDLKLNGSMTDEAKKKSLTLSSVEVNGQTVEIGDLTITVNTSAKMPSVKKYKDILTMSEDEVKALIGEIEEAIEGIASDLIFALN